MLSHSVLAAPYAKAVLELAREDQSFAAWSEQLQLAKALVEHDELAAVLASPRVAADTQVDLLMAASKGTFNAQCHNMLRVLADYRRLALLPAIADGYEELRAEEQGIQPVSVTTAVSLSDSQREQLESALKARFKRDIEAEYAVDESLIGGARVRAGDLVIDASLSGQIDRLADHILHG